MDAESSDLPENPPSMRVAAWLHSDRPEENQRAAFLFG